MEKHPKGDQEKEVCYKNDCDANSSKRTVDRILPHLLNIYGSNATPQDFEIYAPNATFEDPLMCAHGIQQIKSAFYSIPKVFSESRIVDYSVREDVISPSKQEILIDNKQHYKVLGKDITMISLIKLEVEDGKVVRHEDRWDKKPLMNQDTVKFPFIGRILESTRRGSMLATHAMMRIIQYITNWYQSIDPMDKKTISSWNLRLEKIQEIIQEMREGEKRFYDDKNKLIKRQHRDWSFAMQQYSEKEGESLQCNPNAAFNLNSSPCSKKLHSYDGKITNLLSDLEKVRMQSESEELKMDVCYARFNLAFYENVDGKDLTFTISYHKKEHHYVIRKDGQFEEQFGVGRDNPKISKVLENIWCFDPGIKSRQRTINYWLLDDDVSMPLDGIYIRRTRKQQKEKRSTKTKKFGQNETQACKIHIHVCTRIDFMR